MVPPQLIEKVIGSIRERKGLKAEKPQNLIIQINLFD